VRNSTRLRQAFSLSAFLTRPFTARGLTALGLTLLLNVQAAPEQARSADSFVDTIGVNTHLSYLATVYTDNNYQRINQLLPALGVRHIRDGLLFSTPGGFDGSFMYNELNFLATTYGIRSTLTDGRNNETAGTSQDILNSLVRVLPSVIAVTGPNEMDFNGGSTWANDLRVLQQRLYQTVKGDSRTSYLPVVGPSMGDANNSYTLGSLANYLDLGDIHSYPAAGIPTNGLTDAITKGKVISGGKPVVATETCYNTSTLANHSGQPGVSEAAAAKYIPRLYLEYFNLGVVRTFCYEFLDEGTDLQQSESFYGLVRYDGTVKPAYTSLKNLIGLLKETGANFVPGSLDFTLSGNTNNVHRTLLQKSDGSFYLVLWVDGSSYNFSNYFANIGSDANVAPQAVTLTLNTPISQATTYLPLTSTNSTGQFTNPTQLSLSVPDHPLIIKLTPGANTLSDLVVTNTGYTATSLTAGSPVTFTATVKNQGTKATPAGTILGVGFRDPLLGALTYSDTYSQSLAPGASVTLSSNFPWTAALGTFTVQATVDDVNRIVESNENNNSLGQTLTISAAQVSGTGLTGSYFDNVDLTNLKFTRLDPQIAFNWKLGAPDVSLGSDTFSIRWQGQVKALATETYTFYVTSNDGARLWVNDQQLINQWTNHGTLEYSGQITLTAGQKYSIRLEYFDNTGAANASLAWSSPSQAKQIIPTAQLYP